MIRNLPETLIEAATFIIESTLYESMLLEDRIQFLKDRNQSIDTSHDPLAIHKDSNDIIDHFAQNADPTNNKSHTQWILGQYKKGNIVQSDAVKIHGILSNFEKYKPKLDKKDINQYKTTNDIEGAVSPHIGSAVTRKEKSVEAESMGRTLVHQDDSGLKVYKLENTPEGKSASQDIYGGGYELGGTHTSWCTSARGDKNLFAEYSKHGHLHVIHTPSGNVYQAHHKIGQLMDSHNKSVNNKNEDVKHITSGLDHIPNGWQLKLSHSLPISSNDVSSAVTNPETEDYSGKKVAHMDALCKYNLSAIALHEVIGSPNVTPQHKSYFIENGRNIDASHIQKAISLHNPSINMGLLDRNDLTSGHLTQLINDPDVWVVNKALTHNNITKDHINYAVNHESPKVRAIVSGIPHLSIDQIRKLKNDPNSHVRDLANR